MPILSEVGHVKMTIVCIYNRISRVLSTKIKHKEQKSNRVKRTSMGVWVLLLLLFGYFLMIVKFEMDLILVERTLEILL